MEEFDKDQVKNFMELVNATLYRCIEIYEKTDDYQFMVRDDNDMDKLVEVVHMSVDITLDTLKNMSNQTKELQKSRFKIINCDTDKGVTDREKLMDSIRHGDNSKIDSVEMVCNSKGNKKYTIESNGKMFTFTSKEDIQAIENLPSIACRQDTTKQ